MEKYDAEKVASSLRTRTNQEKEEIIEKIIRTRPKSQMLAWFFGYGSLMWNPEVNYTKSVVGTLKGYHRKYCLWSILGRGTPEKPGLMMGLWKGGECIGALFCLPEETVREEISKLVHRECRWGVYIPRWLPIHTGNTTVMAIVFTLEERHPVIVRDLSQEEMTHYIATAEGTRGTCREYLFNTLGKMKSLGIADEPIERLGKKVHEYANQTQMP